MGGILKAVNSYLGRQSVCMKTNSRVGVCMWIIIGLGMQTC
jgi:hypothetical protein